MMDKEKNNILATLSVKDISSIFFRIDEQIIELHNCSSEDFLGLNADFKKYYKQSKVISENANEIFKSLTEGGSGALFRELQNLYKDIKNAQDHFVNQLGSSLVLINGIHNSLDLLFLPTKNLNQDLMTLKFLLTNLKLSSSYYDGKNTINSDKFITDYGSIINDLKQCSHDNENNISNLLEEVSKGIMVIDSILKRTQTDLDLILNNIHYGIILFAEKYEETNRQIPELTQKTERSSQSIADIVTNLQFQDIIRQKIEHIQETHKGILDELERFGETIDRSDTEKQTKLLLKIRDIAGLQAAILVKANKEYQLAIEKITDEFLAIGNDMTGISVLCKDISKTNENSEEFHLSDMLHKLQDSAVILTNFIEAGSEYTVTIEKIGVSINNTIKGISTYSELNKKLKSITASISLNIPNDINSNDILTQFLNVNEDIQKFEEVIIENFKKVVKCEENLSIELCNFCNQTKNQKYFGQAVENMNVILNQLKERSDRINLLLNENLDLSKSISTGVKESIKNIRYYDLFEKNIVDIIIELNKIYKKIKGEYQDENERAENLKTVKDLYTMESEFIIHNKVVDTNEEIDLFTKDDITKDIENTNSDEVELF